MAGRVLIFEGEEAFAEELRTGFEELGLNVLVSIDGVTGINYAQEAFPDLVVASAELKGMNGFLICKKFKKNERLKHIPFVILSRETGGDVFEQHKKLSTRAQDYIKKPIGVPELLERLGRFLPGQSGDDAGVEQDVEIGEWTMDVHEKPTATGELSAPEAPVEAPASAATPRAEPAAQSAPRPRRSSVRPPAHPPRTATSSTGTPLPPSGLPGAAARPVASARGRRAPSDRPPVRSRSDRPPPLAKGAVAPARQAPISDHPAVPRLLIVCTREGRAAAESVQLGVYPDIEAEIRAADAYGQAQGGLGGFVKATVGFESALLLVAEGDLDRRSANGQSSPRENLGFVLGFLLGRFGEGRTFVVAIDDLASGVLPDLAGITPIEFAIPEDGDLLAATDLLCASVKETINRARIG